MATQNQRANPPLLHSFCVLLLALSTALVCHEARGQTQLVRAARNAIFLELFGNGGLYSLNYDRLITDNVSARLGFASWTASDFLGEGETSLTTVAGMANYFVGRSRHRLEFGAGLLAGRRTDVIEFGTIIRERATVLDLTGAIAYRYQKPTRGLLFRASLTPFFSLQGDADAYPDDGLFLSGGISIGYSF